MCARTRTRVQFITFKGDNMLSQKTTMEDIPPEVISEIARKVLQFVPIYMLPSITEAFEKAFVGVTADKILHNNENQ